VEVCWQCPSFRNKSPFPSGTLGIARERSDGHNPDRRDRHGRSQVLRNVINHRSLPNWMWIDHLYQFKHPIANWFQCETISPKLFSVREAMTSARATRRFFLSGRQFRLSDKSQFHLDWIVFPGRLFSAIVSKSSPFEHVGDRPSLKSIGDFFIDPPCRPSLVSISEIRRLLAMKLFKCNVPVMLWPHEGDAPCRSTSRRPEKAGVKEWVARIFWSNGPYGLH
jgi:hypothetical protein